MLWNLTSDYALRMKCAILPSFAQNPCVDRLRPKQIESRCAFCHGFCNSRMDAVCCYVGKWRCILLLYKYRYRCKCTNIKHRYNTIDVQLHPVAMLVGSVGSWQLLLSPTQQRSQHIHFATWAFELFLWLVCHC